MKSLSLKDGQVIDNFFVINEVVLGVTKKGTIAYTKDDGYTWVIIFNNPNYEFDTSHMKCIGNQIYAISGLDKSHGPDHAVKKVFLTTNGILLTQVSLDNV